MFTSSQIVNKKKNDMNSGIKLYRDFTDLGGGVIFRCNHLHKLSERRKYLLLKIHDYQWLRYL